MGDSGSREVLGHTGRVAAPKKQRKPGADEAKARALAAHAKMRAAEEMRAEGRAERAVAITEGLELGLTLKELAEAFGVGIERIRQMKEGK